MRFDSSSLGAKPLVVSLLTPFTIASGELMIDSFESVRTIPLYSQF